MSLPCHWWHLSETGASAAACRAGSARARGHACWMGDAPRRRRSASTSGSRDVASSTGSARPSRVEVGLRLEDGTECRQPWLTALPTSSLWRLLGALSGGIGAETLLGDVLGCDDAVSCVLRVPAGARS